MPRPVPIEPLPAMQNLPPFCRTLADIAIRHEQASPDLLLLLADACDEAALYADKLQQPSLHYLALVLRRRAPSYA